MRIHLKVNQCQILLLRILVLSVPIWKYIATIFLLRLPNSCSRPMMKKMVTLIITVIRTLVWEVIDQVSILELNMLNQDQELLMLKKKRYFKKFPKMPMFLSPYQKNIWAPPALGGHGDQRTRK